MAPISKRKRSQLNKAFLAREARKRRKSTVHEDAALPDERSNADSAFEDLSGESFFSKFLKFLVFNIFKGAV